MSTYSEHGEFRVSISISHQSQGRASQDTQMSSKWEHESKLDGFVGIAVFSQILANVGGSMT